MADKLVIEISFTGELPADLILVTKKATRDGTLEFLRQLQGTRFYNGFARSTVKAEVKSC